MMDHKKMPIIVISLITAICDGKIGRQPLLAIMLGSVSILVAFVPFKLLPGIWIVVLFSILIISSTLATVIDSFMSDSAVGASKAAIITSYVVILDVGAACGPSQ